MAEKLAGLDDGELYLQYTLSESFGFDDGRLKSATFDTTQGFGLRGVLGETTGFAHANELSEAAIRRAGDTVSTIRTGREARWADAPARTNRVLYQPDNPIDGFSFEAKTMLLAVSDA